MQPRQHPQAPSPKDEPKYSPWGRLMPSASDIIAYIKYACATRSSVCMQVRAGLPEGTQFVFERQGDVGPQNKAGPVVYVLKALPHARFSSRGSDLLYTAHIPLYQALCGTALAVETLDGR